MKRIISILFISSLVIPFIMNACASEESEDGNAIELAALQAWIEVNAPDAKLLGDGVYYEVIKSAEPSETAGTSPNAYARINYTIRALDGRIAYTRTEEEARRQGTFTRFTRYIPLFAQVAESEDVSTNLMKGIYRALMKMKRGDVWRLYLPSKYGIENTTVSNEAGYGGETTISGSIPVIIDNLELISSMKDPEGVERSEYNYYLGQIFDDQHPTAAIDNDMYIQRYRTTDESIPKDSLVQLYYVTRVMSDGFIFGTNIDSVQQRVFGRSYSQEIYPYEYIHSAVDTTNTEYIILKALYTVMPNLHYGDSVRIAFTSKYGYGSAGQVGANRNLQNVTEFPILTEIQPYTSLVMDIVVMDKDYDYLED